MLKTSIVKFRKMSIKDPRECPPLKPDASTLIQSSSSYEKWSIRLDDKSGWRGKYMSAALNPERQPRYGNSAPYDQPSLRTDLLEIFAIDWSMCLYVIRALCCV